MEYPGSGSVFPKGSFSSGCNLCLLGCSCFSFISGLVWSFQQKSHGFLLFPWLRRFSEETTNSSLGNKKATGFGVRPWPITEFR